VLKTNHLQYIETYSSDSTSNSSKYSIRSFLTSLFGEGNLEDLAKRYFQEERDRETDIQNFFVTIKHRSPNSIRVSLMVLWNKEAIICDPWRRKFKFDGEGFFFKNRMVLSPERLLKKLGEDCENLTVGFSMRDTPGFK